MNSLPRPSPDRLRQLFVDLASIQSPSRNERAAADYVAEVLQGMGLCVHEDEAGAAFGGDCGNLHCAVPSDASPPGVAFCAHLDTVPPTEKIDPALGADGVFTNRRDTILGADDKAAIAALLHATELLTQVEAPASSYELLFTVCEEDGLLGAAKLDLDSVRSPLAVILDCTGPVGGVVTRAPSQKVITARYRGVAAHAGIEPELGRSAIQAAAKAIADMKLGRLDAETTANVGLISGGVAANIVPASCEIVAECRGHDETVLAQVAAEMVDAVHRAAIEVGVDVDVQVIEAFRAFWLDEESAAVRLVSAALRGVGRTPEILTAGGGSDANVFNLRGLPAVNLSTGMMRAHSPEESIALAEMVKLCELVVSIAASAPSASASAPTDAGSPA